MQALDSQMGSHSPRKTSRSSRIGAYLAIALDAYLSARQASFPAAGASVRIFPCSLSHRSLGTIGNRLVICRLNVSDTMQR